MRELIIIKTSKNSMDKLSRKKKFRQENISNFDYSLLVKEQEQLKKNKVKNEKKEILNHSVGDDVEHIKYGIGKIVNIEKEIVYVRFGNCKRDKTFVKGHECLKIINNKNK